MANALYNDFKNRGFMLVHIMIEDGTGDGTVDWADADRWANKYHDFDGDGTYADDALQFLVLADTDGWLFNNLSGCPLFTPAAEQIWDQGGVIVADPCQFLCSGSCSPNDARVRAKLDAILPPEWCGEATP